MRARQRDGVARIRLLGQASAQYRWGWGDVDRSQLRAGVSLSFNSELGKGNAR